MHWAFRLFSVLVCASTVFGQTSVLRGHVTDESGAVVPGATVTVRGSGNAVRSVNADAAGAYSVADLTPGSYTVQASAPSLARGPVRITLRSGTQTLDLVLQVASMQEKVTVADDAAPALSVDSAANASAVVLRGSDLDALSDDPDDLAADLQALAGPAAGPNGGSIFIDGFSGGELPPKNSIREIRINQN